MNITGIKQQIAQHNATQYILNFKNFVHHLLHSMAKQEIYKSICFVKYFHSSLQFRSYPIRQPKFAFCVTKIYRCLFDSSILKLSLLRFEYIMWYALNLAQNPVAIYVRICINCTCLFASLHWDLQLKLIRIHAA